MPDFVVETGSGRVRGTAIEDVAAFKAIPYGAPEKFSSSGRVPGRNPACGERPA